MCKQKRYDALYADAGYEFGFGRAGKYTGHSHLHFVDVLFAPAGIWRVANGEFLGTLVLVPPRMYLPDIEIGDFAFLKFVAETGPVVIPDKVERRLHGDALICFAREGRAEWPWFRHEGASRDSIKFAVVGAELMVTFGNRHLVVAP